MREVDVMRRRGKTNRTKQATEPAPTPDLRKAAKELGAKADALSSVAGSSPLSPAKLASISEAYEAVAVNYAAVNGTMRELIKKNPAAASIEKLLPIAALSESLRDWFPVDPEMTAVRGTILEPVTMKRNKPEEAPKKKAEDEPFRVLIKRLLGHLAE